jgi:hypothetical protein
MARRERSRRRALGWLAGVAGALVTTAGLLSCSEVAPLVGSEVTRSTDAGGDARPVAFSEIRKLMDRMPDDPTGPGCKRCHYSDQPSHIGLDLGGLDLRTLGSLRQGGGTSGTRIVVPGRPDESAIVQKLKGTYPFGTRMPKSGPPFWSEQEIQLVVDWIAQGALGDDDE